MLMLAVPTIECENDAAGFLDKEIFFVVLSSLLFALTVDVHFVHTSSVTRLGDLLDFGQLFKACGNN